MSQPYGHILFLGDTVTTTIIIYNTEIYCM